MKMNGRRMPGFLELRDGTGERFDFCKHPKGLRSLITHSATGGAQAHLL